MIRDLPEGSDQLVFYGRAVDCETVQNDLDAEDVVLLGEIEPGIEEPLAVGPVPVVDWTWYSEPLEGRELFSEANVSIVRVGDPLPVEGTVTYHGTVDGEEVDLEGPFTATVCEVTDTST